MKFRYLIKTESVLPKPTPLPPLKGLKVGLARRISKGLRRILQRAEAVLKASRSSAGA